MGQQLSMVLGKLSKVYRTGIKNWIVGVLQPVIDNLQKARLRQQGRDQVVLPRRGAALPQGCRASDLKAANEMQSAPPPHSTIRGGR